MDPISLLMLGAKYAPIVISLINGTLSNTDLIEKLKSDAGPIVDLLVQAGSKLFPNAAPILHIVGGAISTFDTDYTVWLQKALNKIDNAGLVVDGNYGPKTMAAVTAFQTKHGLKIDGLAGNVTRALLDAFLQGLKMAPAVPAAGGSVGLPG